MAESLACTRRGAFLQFCQSNTGNAVSMGIPCTPYLCVQVKGRMLGLCCLNVEPLLLRGHAHGSVGYLT